MSELILWARGESNPIPEFWNFRASCWPAREPVNIDSGQRLHAYMTQRFLDEGGIYCNDPAGDISVRFQTEYQKTIWLLRWSN